MTENQDNKIIELENQLQQLKQKDLYLSQQIFYIENKGLYKLSKAKIYAPLALASTFIAGGIIASNLDLVEFPSLHIAFVDAFSLVTAGVATIKLINHEENQPKYAPNSPEAQNVLTKLKQEREQNVLKLHFIDEKLETLKNSKIKNNCEYNKEI